MLRLVLRRLAWSIPLLLVATMVSFILVAFLPGNTARALLGPNATEAQVAAVTEQLGLNKPLWEQYWQWLQGAVHGDLGTSLISRQPVTTLLNDRLEPSLSLIIGATLVAGVVGVILGIRGARRGVLGKVVDAGSIVGLAILWFTSLVLPVITLAVPAAAIIAKQTRDAVSTALNRSFVRTLSAAGVPDRSIVYRHALKNAAIPILTVVGLIFVGALSGTVAVESIYSIPGLGSTAVQATSAHDLPLIQGVVVYFTIIVIAVNLLVDLGYGYFNPRVRQS